MSENNFGMVGGIRLKFGRVVQGAQATITCGGVSVHLSMFLLMGNE